MRWEQQALEEDGESVLAVCMDLDIVTDKWLFESHRKAFLLDSDQYLPQGV